jgi:hypothetical protein
MILPRRHFRTKQVTGQINLKNSVSIVKARDTVFSVVMTLNMLSFRSGFLPNVGGKDYILTPERVNALDGIGFVWNPPRPCWEDRLSELAEYRKIHGHCNVPERYSENIKLGKWVKTQRYKYKLYQEGKTSPMTEIRIQALENLGIEWSTARNSWEASFEELTDYLKIHGHCTVSISGNSKLVRWISTQRTQYRLYPGERSHMTLSRIQGLESIGFEWSCSSWGDRLGELADYRIIHGHCNVPPSYSENIQLARWVTYQRSQYKLQLEGNTSHMTPRRIQELESLGFEWKPSISRRQGTPKKPSLADDATRVCKRAAESPEHMPPHSLEKISVVENSAAVKSTSLSNPKNPTGMANSTLLDAAVAVWLQVGTM